MKIATLLVKCSATIALVSQLMVPAAKANASAVNSESKERTNNEIKGFRYASCSKNICVKVQSERAWLSIGNGSFVTDQLAAVQILVDGQETYRSVGDEAVFLPQLNSLTLESKEQVSMIDTESGRVEIISKGRIQ